jgi:hypothetical protein
VGNPASLYPNEIRILFGAAFRADRVVRNSIIGFEDANLQKMAPNVAYHAGFGSLYWMEGVVFRLQVQLLLDQCVRLTMIHRKWLMPSAPFGVYCYLHSVG